MRKRYIQIDGKLVDADEIGKEYVAAPMVIGDIGPYKSMVDGSMISSRSSHREHLKQHGLIEIGNEINAHMKREAPKVDREGIRRAIANSIDKLSHN